MARRAKLLMVQGTSSGAGKSTLVAGLCRMYADRNYRVVPFKSQNMSSKLYLTKEGAKMAQAQAVQAVASKKQPDPRMNPILLKPLGEYRSEVIINGRFYSEMHARDYYEKFALKQGLPLALKALDGLRRENDLVIIEGAGSPAEINIAKYDIANMLLAEEVGAPVVIVADIERGGCFASMVGTLQLLKTRHRALVKGFLINKFRGDRSLLEPAITETQKLTKKRILGVIPKIDFDLPEEDSLVGSATVRTDLPQDAWDWQIGMLAKAIKDSIDVKRLDGIVGI
ncbi:cobyric acid synthase [Candidatus Nitrososphaera evergladensis SR1]|uniref:Probable cobyric acid synthase n=1 Tax=Candidatus Nitrososphaera evergladensis SR1 TaxID=1459636 RepID=A0A075N0Z0_9ARCH|nr:cobyric acid synthase [Candidatus Nitrososphaera evergladensis]AIF85149.1 cobyric acid synthase [Candidatus Nitrososphaera evergladensis SR1]